MYSIEKAQDQTQGRHSGWATLHDCMIAVNATNAQLEIPTLTIAEIKTTIERYLGQGLLDTKYCDTDGQIQQYVKLTSDWEDLSAYRGTRAMYRMMMRLY
jgi:hypothetical protein